jgi:hypothetical protein
LGGGVKRIRKPNYIYIKELRFLNPDLLLTFMLTNMITRAG